MNNFTVDVAKTMCLVFDSQGDAGGGKRMNEAAISRHAEAPLFGEAVLQEAFFEPRSPGAGSSANGSHTAADQAEPPKTVAQVLGESPG
jgi:hypothetical protein